MSTLRNKLPGPGGISDVWSSLLSKASACEAWEPTHAGQCRDERLLHTGWKSDSAPHRSADTPMITYRWLGAHNVLFCCYHLSLRADMFPLITSSTKQPDTSGPDLSKSLSEFEWMHLIGLFVQWPLLLLDVLWLHRRAVSSWPEKGENDPGGVKYMVLNDCELQGFD